MSRIEDIINSTKVPITKTYLINEFKRIGLKEKDNVLVHSSLSSLGWVCGGETVVVEALMEVITEEGTIAMPTHSADLSDPIFWGEPPVPNNWFETIRAELPAFDINKTKTWKMGAIVEFFRQRENVVRSNHPQVSFAAWGKYKEEVTKNHSLENSLGENSPLRKMYDLDFKVLLLGVNYDVNTAFHLSEYRAGNATEEINIAPIMEDGQRKLKTFKDIEFKTEMFMFCGEEFEETHTVLNDKIGNADIKIFKIKECVDFGKKYFENMRIY